MSVSAVPTRPIRLALTVSLLCLVVSCDCDGRREGVPDVNVVSFSPDGATYDELAAMELMFDGPVVSEQRVGQKVREPVVEILPALEVTVHWRDRQTLVIKPSAPMTPGTRYTVELTEELPANVPEEQRTHDFVFHPLEVAGMTGADAAWFPPDAAFDLRFNLPVSARDVAMHCRFTAGEASVAIEPIQADEVGPTVTVKPAEALGKGTAYEIQCEGLAAAGGNAPLAAPYSTSVNVYPDAGVASVTPSGSGLVTPDELEVVITTTTPVSLEEIRRRVRIEPAVPGFSGRWMSRGRTSFYQVISLEASTEYALTVRRGLTDEFGQEMAEANSTEFRTTDASPRLHMETGIYAVEAESAGYPVWSRNVSRFAVQCAFVPKAKIPTVLTTTMDYDPWYSDGDHDTLPWETHGLRATTFEVEVPEAMNRWQLHDIDLPARCGGAGRRGMYLAEFRAPEVEAARSGGYFRYPYRLLGNVTNLGVLLKAGPSSGLVWVTQISDGQPVAGASVTVYDPRGRRVHGGTTDAQGILRLPGSTRLLRQRGVGDREDFEEESFYEYDSYRSQRLVVVVEKAGDLAAVDGNWSNGIQIWNFGVPQDTRTGGESTIRGFILSDRGIYRPGEEVHFKGFVREVAEGASPRVPTTRRVRVHVEDSRGSELVSRQVELSDFGGFSFDHNLSPEAPLGDYYVRATIGTHTFREKFVVQEFRPVSFEITEEEGVDAEHHLGERVDLRYNAAYLFGAPVAGAEAEWTVNRRRRFIRFPDYPSYTWEDWSSLDTDYFWSRYDSPQSYVTDGSGRTDPSGNIRVGFQDRGREISGPQDYLVSVAVTDPTDQRVSKRSVITVHPTDMYLGLHTQEFVQAVGMPFAINAVAVTPDGDRVATGAKLTYSKRERRCTRAEGPYAYPSCETVSTDVWSRDIQLRAGGTTTERITPREPGEYLIKVEATDRAGREVAASSMVWIIGEGEAFWSGDESVRMSLIASKEQYDPGDTARLVPQANLSGATVLVTTERSGVIDARVEHLGEGVSGIEVPITGAHAPNVFVSIAAVRGRTGADDGHRPVFRMGVSNLEVSSSGNRLAVQVETEREDYRPGETVNGSVQVLSGGAPARAEVSLSVADEGVLLLIGYQTPDPMKSFYTPWGLGVENGTNWNRIARQRPPLGWEDEDGDDSGAGGDDRMRSRFVSSAFWAPALVTDAEGRATFSFEAPDNLTAFRLMAAAADTGDHFGSADRRIRIRKDLMATPILPRFFNAGDRVRIGVTLHNHTDDGGTATVGIEAQGLWVRTPEQTVEVPAHGSTRATWWARVTEGRREASVSFTARLGPHRDAFERTLEIRKPLIVDQRILARGQLEAAGNVDAELAWSDPTLPRDSRLEVTVDRTGLAELEPSLRYLIEYPYGCLEQTLSSLIPLFEVRDLATSLRIEGMQNQARLRAFTNLGIAKVLRHQHSNGHFSLWPSTDWEPHLTAYALWGLSLARDAGVRLRRDPIDKGIAALRTWANHRDRTLSPGGEVATMAMAAHVLAAWEQPDAGLNARLYEARAALPSYGKALLLRALVKAGAPREQITTLVSELAAQAEVEGDRALVRETGDLSWWWSTDVRSTALTLSALLEAQPDHPLIPQLVEGLKHARNTGGRWGTTQENVYALVGLAHWARARTEGNVQVTVSLGSARLASRTIRGGGVLHISRPLSRLRAGTLRIEADGPVYYGVRTALARAPAEADAEENGFTIRREYLDFETATPVETVRVGQLIKVRVHVGTPEPRQHVAVVDPIPSGCEIVNLELSTESLGADGSSPSSGRRWWRWSHSDLRDDRATAFATRFDGEQVLEYVMRATREGTFAVPGSSVEAMYQPEVNARTNGGSLIVRR